jgi:hypothetical protein
MTITDLIKAASIFAAHHFQDLDFTNQQKKDKIILSWTNTQYKGLELKMKLEIDVVNKSTFYTIDGEEFSLDATRVWAGFQYLQ